MKKNLTELVMILDRSGSMAGLESDTIGGYNAMLEKQKKTEGEVLVSTVLFDHESEVLYNRVPLEKMKKMTDREYYVRGCTALLDAIGSSIQHIDAVQKRMKEEERPQKTVFVITTDGMENASKEYTYERVKKLVERQKEEGWEFLFLGANIDAIATASKFGIGADHAADYNCDSAGTALNFEVLSDAVVKIRTSAKPLGASWKKRIDEDYRKRKSQR